VLKQVVANDDVASCVPRELFVLFPIGVGLVVDDEVDDGGSPI
jgi:hypothetical protein